MSSPDTQDGNNSDPEANGEVVDLKNPPFVTPETKIQVLRDIGIGPRPTRSSEGNIHDRMMDFATETFSLIAEVSPGLVIAIRNAAAKHDPTDYDTDYYAAGMAVVIQALQIQSDYKLINALIGLSLEDLEEMKRTIDKGLDPQGSTIFDKALLAPKISDNQANLRELVNTPSQLHDAFSHNYRAGAAIMYAALGGVWGNLKWELPIDLPQGS